MSGGISDKNDIATLFPEIAKEADGWDPSKVTPGSDKKRAWKCTLGHTWEARPYARCGNGSGCPYCANQRVWPGFNDLKTKFPEVAKQAYGWDPETVIPGSNTKKSWQCSLGHIWEASVNQRTKGRGCIYCASQKVLAGFNDLKTKFPKVSAEADGWNPEEFMACSGKKMNWKCSLGHQYQALISNRTSRKSGCPYCSNQKVLTGFNDLKTRYPEIAKEADGWDPSLVLAGTGKKLNWKCALGHKWTCNGDQRTTPSFKKHSGKMHLGNKCPYCGNRKLLKGFNDLKTKYPEIAQEADGWDPESVIAGAAARKKWICSEGHRWTTTVDKRCSGRGCPVCANKGFNPTEEAWFYLMERPGEEQLGITNEPLERMRTHRNNGWTEIEIVGPFDGYHVQETERLFKQWLKRTHGLVKGTTENWHTKKLQVNSLAELFEYSGIKLLWEDKDGEVDT